MRLKLPRWWLVLAIVYLLLELVIFYKYRQVLISNPGDLPPRHQLSAFVKAKEAFAQGNPGQGFEFLAYFYGGLVLLVGLPTIIATLIYVVKRKPGTAYVLSVGFGGLIILQLVLAFLFVK